MAEHTLVLCGGSGAHVGVAFLRLHTLGYALGFFALGEERTNGKNIAFPEIYLVDQDAGDGVENQRTAWQEVRLLLDAHPGRLSWQEAFSRTEKPDLAALTPLPVGENRDWYRAPFNTLAARFGTSPLLPLLISKRQQQIEFSQGMMASPALGALLFELKRQDEREPDANRDVTLSSLLHNHGRYVVAGSGVGGTGASVGPTLARILARRRRDNRVLATMLLSWFELDEEDADPERRRRAQLRNRLMRENASSALEFYGQTLVHDVAVLPLGMPERALLRRPYAADAGQPIHESYLHAVAAVAALLHFRHPNDGFAPGLYQMGAVEAGRLDGATAIPGGTLQDLANQAATVVDALSAFQKVFADNRHRNHRPAILQEIERFGHPGQIAGEIAKVVAHYQAQLGWMGTTLGLKATAYSAITREAASRGRLLRQGGHPLDLPTDSSAQTVALGLFRWTAQWVRDLARPENGLSLQAAPVGGVHLPTALPGRGVTTGSHANGELTRIPDANLGEHLRAFVDARYLNANGWPHPLAAADFFRRAIERSDARAVRQLQLLLVGVVAGRLQLLAVPHREPAPPVTIERVIAELRPIEGWEGLARYAVVDPRHDDRPIGFSSPYTLLTPVPFMDEADEHRLWGELWQQLSGSPETHRWAEATLPGLWTEDLAICRLQAWREEQLALWGPDAPAWMRVVESLPSSGSSELYGAGEVLTARWGASVAGGQRLIELTLPAVTRDGYWEPPASSTEITTEALLVRLPELTSFPAPRGGRPYERVTFEIPDRSERVYGLWEDHLLALRQAGKIRAFGLGQGGVLAIGVLENGKLVYSRLRDTRLLNRRTIQIQTLTPLEQVPAGRPSRQHRPTGLPDLPIRSEFLDLVLPEHGDRSLLEFVRQGEKLPKLGALIARDQESGSRRAAIWRVRFRGLPSPVEIAVPRPDTAPHRAHWLVWPRFRTTSGAWRAYYLYEHCTDPRLRCDVVWIEPRQGDTAGRLRLRNNQEPELRAYPLAFDSTIDTPSHVGGPPIALVPRSANGEEQGLYLVPLEVLVDKDLELALGVDFGTSHSVGAFRLGVRDAESIDLEPELDSDQPLSLAISEDAEHVAKVVTASTPWLPTYRLKAGPVLPSELLLVNTLDEVKASDPVAWQPLRDFTIPPMDAARSDLEDYLLTDFKWNAGSASFVGKEPALREHYLTLLSEVFLAQLAVSELKGVPRRPIDLTFTYPLRISQSHLVDLQESLSRVLTRLERSLGVSLRLQSGIGLYDESRAAQIVSHRQGEVTLVADLGGGTLDLLISGTNPVGKELPEVADSVRLGGNYLLRRLADHAAACLPKDGGWDRGTETKLRAWMRRLGSTQLFGVSPTSAERVQLREFGLFGFERTAEAGPARQIIERYFRLVTEYLARQLTAYLVNIWFPQTNPKHHDRLELSVQLRGNAWLLDYRSEGLSATVEAVRGLVRQRLLALWPTDATPAPSAERHWRPGQGLSRGDLKARTILGAVSRAMPAEIARSLQRSRTHTLVDVEIQRFVGDNELLPWHTPLPFPTGGSPRVQVNGITPPIPLQGANADLQENLGELGQKLDGQIHDELQQAGNVDPQTNHFIAPIAPLVWEKAFLSDHFLPQRGPR